MLPTASWGQDLADALNAQHSRAGAHVGINNTGGLTTDTLTVTSGSTLPAGDIVTADLATDAVSTIKVQADAITDAKLVFGKIRSRQGGSATDWNSSGTTTYDYSATNTFTQVGCRTISGSTTITFPTAFSQKPLVFPGVITAGTANCFARISAITATTFDVNVITDGGLQGTETIAWIATGE